MSPPKPPKKKKLNETAIITLAVILFFVIAVPAPFKPSIWSYVYRQRLNRHISSYTAPVYIVQQTASSSVNFETYLGWKNSYAVRGSSDRNNYINGYFYYQLSKTGLYPGGTSEGPSKSDMQPYVDALKLPCTPHASGIEMCKIGERFIAKHELPDAYLVSDITKQIFNKNKLDFNKYPLPYDYSPPTEDEITQIANIFLSAKPQPLTQVKKYFKPEF